MLPTTVEKTTLAPLVAQHSPLTGMVKVTAHTYSMEKNNDHITIGNNDNMNSADNDNFTISLWVQLDPNQIPEADLTIS